MGLDDSPVGRVRHDPIHVPLRIIIGRIAQLREAGGWLVGSRDKRTDELGRAGSGEKDQAHGVWLRLDCVMMCGGVSDPLSEGRIL